MGTEIKSAILGNLKIYYEKKDELQNASVTIEFKDDTSGVAEGLIFEEKLTREGEKIPVLLTFKNDTRQFIVEEKLKQMGVVVTAIEGNKFHIEGEGLNSSQRIELNQYLGSITRDQVLLADGQSHAVLDKINASAEEKDTSLIINFKDSIVSEKTGQYIVEEKLKEMGVTVTAIEGNKFHIEGEGLNNSQREVLRQYLGNITLDEIITASEKRVSLYNEDGADLEKEISSLKRIVKDFKDSFLEEMYEEFTSRGISGEVLANAMKEERVYIDRAVELKYFRKHPEGSYEDIVDQARRTIVLAPFIFEERSKMKDHYMHLSKL
jgi:hypothetical protein